MIPTGFMKPSAEVHFMQYASLQDNGTAIPTSPPVFQVRHVTKVYAMGEVQVVG
jgi:hypothetical protein